MNRRQFLAAAAGAAVALRSGRALGASPPRVVVVGAGLAGLVAANELSRAGIDVQVLEGRSVVGGRVRTIHDVFRDGQHAEAGGEFLDASHMALRAYVWRFGLRLERAQVGKAVVFLDGERQPVGAPAAREVRRFWARVDELGRKPDPMLDARSAAWLVERMNLDPLARFIVVHELRDTFTVEPARLSLLHLVTRPRMNTQTYRIAGGNDQLPNALAETLGDRVSAKKRVSRIEWGSGGVTVTAGGEPVHADACVLAVPLPPLREIEVEPALTGPLGRAVEKVQYGLGTKTLLQYQSRFWRARGESGHVVTDLTFQTAWEATKAQPGPRGILTATTAGRYGDLYGKASSTTRTMLAADEIDDVYPESSAFFETGSTSAWHTEDLSGGTFVAFAPGQVTPFRSALLRPAGPLYLAGEHTDALTGTMEGAVRSGRRVAAAISAQLHA